MLFFVFLLCIFFFFNDTATTEIYTLSLHDALLISRVHFKIDSAQNVKRPETLFNILQLNGRNYRSHRSNSPSKIEFGAPCAEGHWKNQDEVHKREDRIHLQRAEVVHDDIVD